MAGNGNGVQVSRLHRLTRDSKLKAFADVSFADSFIVKGFKIFQGNNGLFVGMPSEMGKDGKWHNTAYSMTKEFKQLLNEIVLEAYEGRE